MTLYSKVSGHQAYAHMHMYLLQHRSGFKGLCHKTCQDAWGLPVMYAGALQAWEAIPKQYRHTNLEAVPVGAPIFWHGKDYYGHVALQSARAGYVISTDAPTPDFIGEVPYEYITKYWNKPLLGWSSFYNGRKLHFDGLPDQK